MRTPWFRRLAAISLAVCTVALASQAPSFAQPGVRAPEHARQYRRLLLRNAMVINGSAKPAYGPMDIVVRDGRIAHIRQSGAYFAGADAVIDAGIEWRIKDGTPYQVPTLMKEVKDMVARDRPARHRRTTAGE